MNKYTAKPKVIPEIKSNYERYNLKDNPFPYDPFLEPESDNVRVNGTIYNEAIKSKELKRLENIFLKQTIDGNHKRLGYLIDANYTGRGNGKSALLLHLKNKINNDYGYAVSDGVNRTFALYVKPQPSGQTAKFWQLSEDIIKQILKLDLISDCLITLRYKAIESFEGGYEKLVELLKEEDDFNNLLNSDWLNKNGFSEFHINEIVAKDLRNNGVSSDLANPIAQMPGMAKELILGLSCQQPESWKKKNISIFLFDQLVKFFITANFNGGYILLDEFEKIVDSQKISEKNEFAAELRHNLLEGGVQGAARGFFTIIFAMHPGVPNLIVESWEKSGINARSPLPIGKGEEEPHIIFFNNLQKENIAELLVVYLEYFRIEKSDEKSGLYPFEQSAIDRIAELAKYNTAKTLKFANIVLENLVNLQQEKIDLIFLHNTLEKKKEISQENVTSPDFLQRESSPMEDVLKGASYKS